METGRRDLAGVWTVLASSIPPAGISAARVGIEIDAGEILAGIDSAGRRHILIPLGPGEAARTNTKGRGVQLARLSHDGVNYLTVFCLLPDLYPVFTRFGRELVEAIEMADSPAREAADAFDRWRQLFSEATTGARLGEAALIGLMGELLTLHELLLLGLPSNLEMWHGPFGRVHDFRAAGIAMEVKTTLARDGRIIEIANVDQLRPPPGSRLVLRHIRVEHDPAGIWLHDVVRDVIAAGAHSETLAALLLKLAVQIDHLDVYESQRFRVIETRHYDTAAEHFPKIVRDSFKGDDVPPGALHLRYAIDLTNEPPHPLTDHVAGELLSLFAEDAGSGLDS